MAEPNLTQGRKGCRQKYRVRAEEGEGGFYGQDKGLNDNLLTKYEVEFKSNQHINPIFTFWNKYLQFNFLLYLGISYGKIFTSVIVSTTFIGNIYLECFLFPI